MEFDNWCNIFEEAGLKSISMKGTDKQIYVHEDGEYIIMIESRKGKK